MNKKVAYSVYQIVDKRLILCDRHHRPSHQ